MLPQDFMKVTTDVVKPEFDNYEKVLEIMGRAASRTPNILNEYEAYELFQLLGVNLPRFHYFPKEEIDQIAGWMEEGKKYVYKCQIFGCLHKTNIGGVKIGITKETATAEAQAFIAKLEDKKIEGIIVVEMCNFYNKSISQGELLLSILNDGQFGPSCVFGLGGTGVEWYGKCIDNAQIFLPVYLDFDSKVVRKAVSDLPISKQLLGQVRGMDAQVKDLDEIMSPLKQFAKLARYFSIFNVSSPYVLEELEINPIVVSKEGKLTALDGVVRVVKNPNYQLSQKLFQPFCTSKPLYKLSYLFSAKSVCIVGASGKNQSNPGTVIAHKYLAIPESLRPKLSFIHPKESQLFGSKCYKNLDEHLKDYRPELVILAVPAAGTAQYISELVKLDACDAIFTLAGGFAETEAGAIAEKKLRAQLAEVNSDPEQIAKRPLINGPNTVGYKFVLNNEAEFNTIFLASHKSSGDHAKGAENCALISQSGAFLISRISNLANRVAPKLCFSVGNQLDVTACDCLEWLLNDQKELEKKFGVTDDSELIKQFEEAKHKIQVIAIYIEGLQAREGIKLMHLIAKAREMNKIVILYKAGRSKQGASAVAGHTASLAGSYSQFAELMDMAGAVVCQTSDQLEDAMFAGSLLVDRLKELKNIQRPIRITGQSNAGFERCQMADHLFSEKNCDNYLQLPVFDEPTKKQLTELFDKYKLGEVIDVQQILDTTALLPDKAYEEISTCLLESPSVDAAVISLISEIHMIKTLGGEFGAKYGEDCEHDPDSVIQRYIRLFKEGVKKPWTFNTAGGWKYDIARRTMRDAGVPVFDQCDRACKALVSLIRAVVGRYGYLQ